MQSILTKQQQEWLDNQTNGLINYVKSLESPHQSGRFLPCKNGAAGAGKSIGLGFSGFALKIYHTLKLWGCLSIEKRKEWLNFIKAYQVSIEPFKEPIANKAFIDLPLIRSAFRRDYFYKRIYYRLNRPKFLTFPQQVIIGETKQAIATLAEVWQAPKYLYLGFPKSAETVKAHLTNLDWSKPWSSGGQASALVVFLKTQAPQIHAQKEVDRLLNLCAKFFESLLDSETGAYFKGQRPNYGELINGAMKILTALDWLDIPVHYPDKLIDTTLQNIPSSEGCHLVDAVYVLYRCFQFTDYKRADIQSYCSIILDLIQKHHNNDGGYSYYIGKSQMDYHGITIAKGLAESDIHGTCLLTWALAMIFRILELNKYDWQIIKP
jgi:hypothetical protein